jgi:hypothetical protein
MNLTLVAYYGDKPAPLSKFIGDAQKELSKALPGAFEPYGKEQVHGTLIGLEGTRWGDYIINQNYFEQKLLKSISLPKVLEILKASEHLPFTIQIGGYDYRREYPFTSRNQHPYLRSFSVQRDIAVAMGWPVRDGEHPLTLDRLRRSLNKANVLHRYHASHTDVDNDFFFVLGRVDRAKSSDWAIQVAEERMRSYFERKKSPSVTIDRKNLRVVAYDDTKLPWGKCKVFTLGEAEADLSQLLTLYDDPAA